jgi:protein farnesyltransferase subunit beta
MSVKQPDGSFLVAHHAEVDIRCVCYLFPNDLCILIYCSGIYCLLVTAHLLNILTPELIDGTAAFIASCQTYEGGFASASQPFFSPGSPPELLQSPRPPLGEAHGGYTFCALASWVMLQPFLANTPTKPSINLKTLLRWLTHMQGAEIELGGFKGRTNKLVDGCYSWWVGGAFALLAALGVGGGQGDDPVDERNEQVTANENWDDVDGRLFAVRCFAYYNICCLDSLFNRKGLQEYILFAGQHPAGGLRDKPPK